MICCARCEGSCPALRVLRTGCFALVFFLSMLAFALYPGQGVFRLGFFLEIALGAAAYFLTLSRLLLANF